MVGKNSSMLNAREFLSDTNRNRIFNIDESGFLLQGTAGKCKIIAEKGCEIIHRLAPDTIQQIPVLASVSAAGEFNKPFVIFFQEKDCLSSTFQQLMKMTMILDTARTNYWISSDAFFGWIAFFSLAIKDKVTFPISVFMNGFTAHINVAVSDFLIKH